MPVLSTLLKSKFLKAGKQQVEESLTGAAVTGARQDAVDFVNNIQKKINAQMGNSIPVSAFKDYVDGSTPSGTSAYEKAWCGSRRSGMGCRINASSVTSVLMSARTQQSVRLL